MVKVGRNDPCPCGSGKKFKRCHLEKDNALAHPHALSIKQRNDLLLEAIIDITGLGTTRDWDALRRDLSSDHVREIHRVYAQLWPRDTDLLSLLPEPSADLRAFYMGELSPLVILRNVVRYGLYTDEILVTNPILNAWTVAPEYNPVIAPELHKQNTLEAIGFIFQLAPWIQAGIVNLIPSAMDFDYELRKAVYTMAEERYEDFLSQDPDHLVDKKRIEQEGKREWFRVLSRQPTPILRDHIRRVLPSLSDAEIENHVRYIAKRRKADPYILDQPMGPSGELRYKQMGGNLEMSLFMAHATGSYIYSNHDFQWRELLSVAEDLPGEGGIWTPLTQAFQGLHFKFLDKVDAGFAYKLREDGRLEHLRSLLRDIWHEVSIEPKDQNTKARQFAEQLTEEHARAREEWDKIDKSLLRFAAAGAPAAMATGTLDWRIPVGGFVVPAVLKLLEARKKRRTFRETVPLSVFVDLERRK